MQTQTRGVEKVVVGGEGLLGVSGPGKRKPTVSFKPVILLDRFASETVAPEGLNRRISTFLAEFWGR